MNANWLLGELVAVLQPEGSDLTIQKANSHNLDWTFRAELRNGVTGASVSGTGSHLEMALLEMLAKLR